MVKGHLEVFSEFAALVEQVPGNARLDVPDADILADLMNAKEGLAVDFDKVASETRHSWCAACG